MSAGHQLCPHLAPGRAWPHGGLVLRDRGVEGSWVPCRVPPSPVSPHTAKRWLQEVGAALVRCQWWTGDSGGTLAALPSGTWTWLPTAHRASRKPMLGSGEVSDPPFGCHGPSCLTWHRVPAATEDEAQRGGEVGRGGSGRSCPPAPYPAPPLSRRRLAAAGFSQAAAPSPARKRRSPTGGGPVRGCLHPLHFWGHGAPLEGDLCICGGVGTLPAELGAVPVVRASCRAAGSVLGAAAVAALRRGQGSVPDPQEGWPRPEAWVCVLGPAAVLPLLGAADLLIGQTPRGPPSASWYREVQETGALGTPAPLKETSAPARVLFQEHGLGRERLLCRRS